MSLPRIPAVGSRRASLAAALVAIAAAAALLTSGPALAVGTEPGSLQLSPPTGALATQATWSTTTACPAGFQASAAVSEFLTDGTFLSDISVFVEGTSVPVTGGELDASVGALLNFAGFNATTPGTTEWVVGCYSGGGGTGGVSYVQSLFVTATANGTYTTSATAPTEVATATSMAASPNPATSGTKVALTATVTAADGTAPAGTVTFFNGGTAINTTPASVIWTTTAPVTGTATITTAFTATASTSLPLTATFTPTNTAGYGGSTSAVVTESVNPGHGHTRHPGVGSEPGSLVLNPPTGPLATMPTWSTTTACPAGFQASAQVSEFLTDGTFLSSISFVVPGAGAPISGAELQGSVGAILGFAGFSATTPGTVEWVVGCYSGPAATGHVAFVQSVFVTATASGTYTTSAKGPR